MSEAVDMIDGIPVRRYQVLVLAADALQRSAWLTAEQFAVAYTCKLGTVRKWMAAGTLPSKDSVGQSRIDNAEFCRLMECKDYHARFLAEMQKLAEAAEMDKMLEEATA